MGKYIGHRLVAGPELDNTFWTDSSLIKKMLFFFLTFFVFSIKAFKAREDNPDILHCVQFEI